MKLLLDVNVVLDHLLGREPWYREAAALLSVIEAGGARGFLAGHTATTIHYIVSSNRNRETATRVIAEVLDLLTVVPVGANELRQALTLDGPDFEDAVQAVCARAVEADVIVTRDRKGFPDSPIPAEPPGAVLARL